MSTNQVKSDENSISALHILIASKDEELNTLKANFDEYIASSRELEEELEAEITALHDKMAESSSANRSLAAQLNSVTPQIETLESQVQTHISQIAKANEFQRKAEQKADVMDNKCREMEMSLERMQESEVQIMEELALKEGELEDLREEYEHEVERMRDEIEDLKGDNAMLKTKLREMRESSDKDMSSVDHITVAATEDGENGYDDDKHQYINSLEEELEDVSEQLIEAQAQVNEVATQLEDALNDREESERLIMELSEKIKILESQSNAQELDNEDQIRLTSQIQHLEEDAAVMTEELELAHGESLQMQQQLESLEIECKKLKEIKAEKDTKIHHLKTQCKLLFLNNVFWLEV